MFLEAIFLFLCIQHIDKNTAKVRTVDPRETAKTKTLFFDFGFFFLTCLIMGLVGTCLRGGEIEWFE